MNAGGHSRDHFFFSSFIFFEHDVIRKKFDPINIFIYHIELFSYECVNSGQDWSMNKQSGDHEFFFSPLSGQIYRVRFVVLLPFYHMMSFLTNPETVFNRCPILILFSILSLRSRMTVSRGKVNRYFTVFLSFSIFSLISG